jgi:cysteinyl-tRNA synthetase
VTLRLYDTATRAVRDFVPLVEGRVGIYLCGATVQAAPHIGHIRSGIAFDVLRRWLERTGSEVTFVRNVTDIDDKILRNAAAEGVPWWALATRNKRAFEAAYATLGCLPPTVEPLATGHVPEMIALMRTLIDRDCAYAADGDVYFDVRSYPAYGELSRQRLDNMQPAADVDDDNRKRDPRDFALWKGAKPGEPTWETPWGDGRPGWHLECSAMARKYLGPVFDIHAGGLDLLFPHHENEVAQSRAAGDEFARYWLHNAWVTLSGEKMSKSLGNTLTVAAVTERVRPVELRYYLVAAHYRSNIEYSEQSLEEAAAAYRRIEGFAQRAAELVGDVAPGPVPQAFAAALDDDLGVPAALSVVHGTVRDGNTALADGDKRGVASALAEARGMLDVLGLDPFAEPWSGGTDRRDDAMDVLDRLVSLTLRLREEARNRKDYATADQIRAGLSEAGLVVEDTPSGPRWSLGPGR